MPSTRLKDIIFWSTIAFSLSGLESASMMGDEIRNPRRNIPRALLIGRRADHAALHPLDGRDAGGAAAVADPEPAGLHALDPAGVATGSGIAGLTALTALLITLGGLGQAGAWFAAGGRLPFVAGIDRFLPPAFGRIHPRYGSPHVSLLIQAAVAAVFIFLGQAGTTVKGAYDVLVSMSIIGYFIPYLFMFASMIKLQSRAGGPGGDAGARRASGGDAARRRSGSASPPRRSCLALIPAEDEPNKVLAVTKVAGLTVLLLLGGAVVVSVAESGGAHERWPSGESTLRDLDAARWRVALGLTAAMVVLYFGFILLVAYGRALLAIQVVPGLTLGILLGALVIVASWILTWVYVRWAAAHYDPGIGRWTGRAAVIQAPRTTAIGQPNAIAMVFFFVFIADHARASPGGRRGAPGPPSSSTPPAARSAPARTASRSPATT